jgi:hypothetical protein
MATKSSSKSSGGAAKFAGSSGSGYKSGGSTTGIRPSAETPVRSTNRSTAYPTPQAVRTVAKDQSRIPPTSSMQPFNDLRQYVSKNTGPANPMARAMTGPQVSMGAGSTYRVGDLTMGSLRQPKSITASIGDDMASGIENRVAARLSQPKPLRGISTQGRNSTASPMISPMAGQGAPYPGPTSPVAGRAGFPAYQDRLKDTMMTNYNRGREPDIQMAGSPSSTGSPSSLIGDSEDSLVSPNTLGRGAGGLIGSIVGGPVGGLLGSKLGGFAVDKAREYGHPLYGRNRGENQIAAEYDDPSLNVGLGRGGLIDPLTGKPSQGNSAVQSTPQPKSTIFRPRPNAYPEYYSSWAGLPKGLFG